MQTLNANSENPVVAATSVHCFSRTPAFRLAEQWINEASKKIEIFTAENGEPEEFAVLRQNLRVARDFMGRSPQGDENEKADLFNLLTRHLRPSDFRSSEIKGAYWLMTPMGEIPILALPDGESSELTCRSKAHVLGGLAAEHDENPLAAGFLYLPTPAVFQHDAEREGNDFGWLRSQHILPVDTNALRVLLVALRCSGETRDRLKPVSNTSVGR